MRRSVDLRFTPMRLWWGRGRYAAPSFLPSHHTLLGRTPMAAAAMPTTHHHPTTLRPTRGPSALPPERGHEDTRAQGPALSSRGFQR